MDEKEVNWKELSVVLSALTHVEDEEWLYWLENDVKPALSRDKSLLKSENGFKMELEDSLEALIGLSEDLAEQSCDAALAQVAHVTRKFLMTSAAISKTGTTAKKEAAQGGAKRGAKGRGRGGKGAAPKKVPETKKRVAKSDVFLSEVEVCRRISRWLSGDSPNGIVCHKLSPSFFSLVTCPSKQGKKIQEQEEEERIELETKAINALLFHPDSKKVWLTDNAGGTSQLSEGVSFEVVAGLVPIVRLDRTETEIEYQKEESSITDYSVVAGGEGTRLGVSVTRAMEFQSEFGEEEAQALLEKKLEGVIESTQLVSHACGWEKQILHILASSEKEAAILTSVYLTLPDSLQSTTLVLISACPEPPSSSTPTQLLVQSLINRIFFSSSSEKVRNHKVSIGKIKSVFVKELAALNKCKLSEVGAVDFSLPRSVMECEHGRMVGEKIGGPECMVCGFGTEKRVWKCTMDCGLILCGSCAWKWKERL